MSIRLMSMMWEIRFPTQSQLLIALKLADFANDDGSSVYPSRNRLSKDAQCSESTVKNTLRAFRDIGLLIVIEEGGKGPKDTTQYAWNLPLLKALAGGDCTIEGGSEELEIKGSTKGAEFDPLDAEGVNPEAEGVSPDPAKGSTGYPQSIKNHHLDSSTRGSALATQSAARPALEVRRAIVVRAGEPPWREWMEAISTRVGQEARDAAEMRGEIVVHDRWPKESTPMPVFPTLRKPAGCDA